MERKIISLVLAIAVAFAHIYPGISIFINPSQWQIFVPGWLTNIVSSNTFLYLHAFFDLAVVLLILYPRTRLYGSSLASINFILIILSNLDNLFILFRDVSLLIISLLIVLIELEPIVSQRFELHLQ
ncbi:hypothetical protein KW787_02155 [Candidatus Pacearchaeota archaeon]|nr:hypothetical protein [Candidatus Pacearchaeota archaeon]